MQWLSVLTNRFEALCSVCCRRALLTATLLHEPSSVLVVSCCLLTIVGTLLMVLGVPSEMEPTTALELELYLVQTGVPPSPKLSCQAPRLGDLITVKVPCLRSYNDKFRKLTPKAF